jgi:hypothetical protein
MVEHVNGLCGDRHDEMAVAVEAIQLLSRLWDRRSCRAKRLLEHGIAALLYYLPGSGNIDLWSGWVSRGMLAIWLQRPGVRPCRSHEIARTVTARALLKNPPRTVEEFVKEWHGKYGVFSLVTRAENVRRKHYGDRRETPAEANRAAGIELVVASREELRGARRGNHAAIRQLLSKPTSYWDPSARPAKTP